MLPAHFMVGGNFSSRTFRMSAETFRKAAVSPVLIAKVRDEKFPPTMKCAGSIFKNFLMKEIPQAVQSEVPEKVVREGKIPAAYFLEQVGAKGLVDGGIHVADYHANLIYNDGNGTAAQLCRVIDDLKQRIAKRYGMLLEEEVQYVGFGETRRAG